MSIHNANNDNNDNNAGASSEPKAPKPVDSTAPMGFDAARRRLAARQSADAQSGVLPVAAISDLAPSDNPVTRYLAGRSARELSMLSYVYSLRIVQRRLAESGFGLGDETVPAMEFPWHHVGPSEAAAFMECVTAAYPNQHSRATLIKALRALIRQCVRAELIAPRRCELVLEVLPVPSVPPKRAGREISTVELEQLFMAARCGKPFFARRDEAMMAVMLSTGVRSSELVDLDLSDLDLKSRSLRVNKTKGGRSILTWLHPVAMETVEAWLEVRGLEPGPLFNTAEGGRLATITFRQRMQRLVKRAGIERATPHDFRRTCITWLLRNGTDPFVVARIAGHRKISTTLMYDRRTELEDRDAVLSLDLSDLGKNRRKKTE